VNSNQFLTLLQKGNDLQKEDFQQLVKLHASFPYFQIPAVLAAKYENQKSKDGSSELLHKAAILSPNRSWLKSLIENNIPFLEEDNLASDSIQSSPDVVIIDSQKDRDPYEISETDEEIDSEKDNKRFDSSTEAENKSADDEDISQQASPDIRNYQITEGEADPSLQESEDDKDVREEKSTTDPSSLSESPKDDKSDDKVDIVSSSHPVEEPAHPLITTPTGGDEGTRPDMILPYSDQEDPKNESANKEESKPELSLNKEEEENKPIIAPLPNPPSSRQDILKQLEDNLAKLKLESSKNKPAEEVDDDEEEEHRSKPRRKRSGEDLIDSIKKKEKREIKDNKKKEQNDIIKAFNKKSIKMAAIKENEDVNKLQDLSLPSTKINDRMVSESYAKLLTQQGKKAAAKEIYKKLILKFPQKKAYFADLIQQLEE